MNFSENGYKNVFLAIVVSAFIGVIGISFAYFTAVASAVDSGSATKKTNTANLSDVTLTPTVLSGSTNAIYPGTKNWAGASVKATKKDTSASGTYTVSYTVTATVNADIAFTQGDITYELFKTTSPVAKPVTCPGPRVTEGTLLKYFDNCTTTLTSPVDSGTLSSSVTSGTLTFTDTIEANGTATNYYYLIATYPNKESTDQKDDMGKTLTLNISKVEATALKITGN